MGIYDNVKLVCKEKNVSINQLEKKLGFAKSSIAKFNVNIPSSEKLSAIAKELGCPVDRLINNDYSVERDNNLDVAEMLKQTLDQLEAKQEALMFNGKALDDETRELLIISLENSFRIASVNADKRSIKKSDNKDK